MSTAVCTTTTTSQPADRSWHSRDANAAGAPLPHVPRRTSSSSARPAGAGAPATRASAPSVSNPDFVSTATHVGSASARAPAAVVVQPPTPPHGEQMTNADGHASDSSSDGSQIVVASARAARIRGQRASSGPATPAPLPELMAPIRFIDASPHTARPRHQHALSLDTPPTFSPPTVRSVSDTPGLSASAARAKSGRPLKSSLKMRSPAQRADLSLIIPNATSRSEPVTPKAVHFDAQLERVKLFIARQKPSAVSRDGSPTDDTSGTDGDWPAFIFGPAAKAPDAERAQKTAVAMNVVNLPDPAARMDEDIVLEELTLAPDASAIHGRVRVRNLAFEKAIVARFTLDNWQTTSEVGTRYVDSLPGGTHDRFAFAIRLHDHLARIDGKALLLALRYNVAGREIWDNNRGANYHATFARKALPAPPAPPAPQPRATLPRSPRRRAIAAALSDEDVADLHGKLEAVARSSGAGGGSSPTRAGSPASPSPAERFSFRSDPLATRYDFAAAARRPWRPTEPSVPRTAAAAGVHVRADTHPQAAVPWPAAERPAARKTLADAFALPARSPRVADEDDLAELTSPRRYSGYDDDADRPFAAKPRRHTRGYFDLAPPGFAAGAPVRRTPPGTPGAIARASSFPQGAVAGAGTGPGLASAGNVVCPVPGRAPGLLRPAWGAALLIPHARAGSEESTPSITSGESSAASSPGGSPAELERLASPVDESYSAFLNRFCFFTGPGAVSTPGASEMQRSHSASSVEALLATPPARAPYAAQAGADTPERPSSADSVRTAGSAATLRA